LSRPFNIRRLIKRLLLSTAVLIVLVVVLVFMARHLLTNNGISYQTLSFRFPATAKVEGLVIENDALSLQAGTVRAQWSWRALLRGNIAGQMLSISNAVMRIKSSTAETDTTSSLPLIDIRQVTLNNVQIRWGTDPDTTTVLLRQVDVVGLRYDGALTLDSLINNQSSFTGSYSVSNTVSMPADAATKGTGLSIQSIPSFHVRYFEFRDCDFLVHYGEHRYAVNQFAIEFSGLNNHDVLNMSLQRLSFRYQDSLNVAIVLNDASVDKQNDAHLKDVFIELPGLRLAAPELTLSNHGGFGASAMFDSSYFNTDLLNFFFPTLQQWIPGGTTVVVDGRFTYQRQQLVLDHAALTLGNDGKTSGSGFMQFGTRGDSLKVDLHEFNSTLYGLAKWGGFKVPTGQKNVPLHTRAQVSGTYSHLHATGRLDIHHTFFQYKTDIVRVRDGIRIGLSLASPLFEPGKIVSSFENDFRIMRLSLKGTTLVSRGKIDNVRFEFEGDSVYTGSRWLDAPSVTASYAPARTIATIASDKNQYMAQVDIKGDVISGNSITCSGILHFQMPRVDNVRLTAGDLYTRFHGTIAPRTPSAELLFDTLRFTPQGHTPFTTKAQLSVAQLPDKSHKAFANIDGYLTLEALVGEDVTAWLEREDKFAQFPTAALSMSLHADTTLLKTLVGTPAHIDIDKLTIISRPNDISINFTADTLRWLDFQTTRLAGTANYHPGELTGKIETPELVTPFAIFDRVKFEVVTQQDSAFTITLNTFLPEIERPLGLSYHVASLPEGYRVSFADSTLQLGLQRWRTEQGGSLFVGRAFDTFNGELRIRNGVQAATLEGTGNELLWKLERLDVFPIANTIAAEPSVRGLINATVSSNFKKGIYRWEGGLTGATIDTVQFGNLEFKGAITPDSLSMRGQLRSSAYEVLGVLDKTLKGPSQFDIRVKDLNLSKFSSLLPVPPSTLTVNGLLNADIHGSYGDKLMMKGFVAFPNTELISSEYDVYLKSDNDSLVLNGTTASVHDFVIRDRHGNPINIQGNVQLTESMMDISIKSDRFRLLDRTQKKATVTGEVDLACDVRISGQDGNYKVTGNIATLSGANVTYLYKSTVTLDDRQREMEFVSFTELETEVKKRPKRKVTRNPLEWDVTIDVGKIDVTVLFSEVNQDHIKTTASGRVAFTTGISAEPSAFGIIESNSGDIAYHVPMISDLRMAITKAGVRWVGDVSKPLLIFNGSQVFRISPNEISSLWTNKTDRWPISVIAKVNDRPMNDLVLDFDLSSTNNQVSEWISTLPPDSRQAYAVSLLLRGRINTDGATDINLLTQTMVSKMNEISSRNIKSADLSFYDDSRGPNSTDGSTNKIGYSISKGLMNKKVRIVVGGTVDLTGQQDRSMPDVKVEYILREDPTITLRASKANVYTGVIDGNVDESSLGVTYIKRFRNLFNSHKNRSKE